MPMGIAHLDASDYFGQPAPPGQNGLLPLLSSLARPVTRAEEPVAEPELGVVVPSSAIASPDPAITREAAVTHTKPNVRNFFKDFPFQSVFDTALGADPIEVARRRDRWNTPIMGARAEMCTRTT